MSVVSSVNFRSLTEGSLELQLLVYMETSSGERTQPWGAPVLVERLFDINFPSLTSYCLSFRKLVIHWQIELGTQSPQTGSSHKSLICPCVAGWSADPCWLHHPWTCFLSKQTAGGPVRVQWCPSDKPEPVFQMTSQRQTLKPQICSH